MPTATTAGRRLGLPSMRADAIIFGSPTYMGTVAGSSEVRRRQRQTLDSPRRGRTKVFAGFSTMNGDKLLHPALPVHPGHAAGGIWVGTGLMPSIQAQRNDVNCIGSSLQRRDD